MKEREKEEFFKAYNLVFDDKNRVKLCGREKCRDLISKCLTLSEKEENYFGSAKTGMMNIDNIISLKKEMLL